jgi:2-oxoglutarate/2-oxoacid ferredoxin oxidoreductase subunit alpha
MSTDLAIGIAGAGGDGIVLLGEMLAKATAKVGLHTILTKSFGPQIRGGESSSRIRVSDRPIYWGGDKVDSLMVFHWADLVRFKAELMFKKGAEIIVDSADDTPDDQIPLPEVFKPRIKRIPFEEIALQAVKTKQAKNMVLAGVCCGLYNWPEDGLKEYIEQRFAKQGAEVIANNLLAVDAGKTYARDHLESRPELRINYTRQPGLVFISGNDAFAYGALCAGCRFMAGYPITPATEILEWMSKELPRFDGVCVQAEDELSAICMVVGASFAGVRPLTATSGPGLSLKSEGIGLGVIAELPMVICDVQRGGPATGLPTRTEQSDLNIAIYGGHGDCPRVVLAPTNTTECYELAHQAFEIADRFQTPVIVLLDQFLGHSWMSCADMNIRHNDPKVEHAWAVKTYQPEDFDAGRAAANGGTVEEHQPWRRWATPEQIAAGYKRYQLTDDGISPMTAPGMPGGGYTAVGIEHTEGNLPASSQVIHQAQNEKRYRKFAGIARDYTLFDRAGVDKPQLGILTWGSNFGVCEEICELLNRAGLRTQLLAPQILYPLPWQEIQKWLNGLSQLVTVETNYSDQFYHYIKAFLELPEQAWHYSRSGGIPMYLTEVLNFIMFNIQLPDGFDRSLIEERLNW